MDSKNIQRADSGEANLTCTAVKVILDVGSITAPIKFSHFNKVLQAEV